MSRANPLEGVTERELLNYLAHVDDAHTNDLNQNGDQMARFRTIKGNAKKLITYLDVEHTGYGPAQVILQKSEEGYEAELAEDLSQKGTAGLTERYGPALEYIVREFFAARKEASIEPRQ